MNSNHEWYSGFAQSDLLSLIELRAMTELFAAAALDAVLSDKLCQIHL
jgi:hypothetical protein